MSKKDYKVGQTIARMVYTKKSTGDTKVYTDLTVEEVHDNRIVAKRADGEYRSFLFANIKTA